MGERKGLRLSVVKRPRKDIGSVIQKPESADLIQGVEIEVGAVHPDDRGVFTELFRFGASGIARGLVRHKTLQASAAVSYPGIIKALHHHFEQTDCWAPATLVYLTDRFYNPADEGRLEYNHHFLNYDWELQHK